MGDSFDGVFWYVVVLAVTFVDGSHVLFVRV